MAWKRERDERLVKEILTEDGTSQDWVSDVVSECRKSDRFSKGIQDPKKGVGE